MPPAAEAVGPAPLAVPVTPPEVPVLPPAPPVVPFAAPFVVPFDAGLPVVAPAAEELPPGTARELLLRRARLAETASHMNEWLHSPGLQPPT